MSFAVTAMIKCLRRGREMEALYWARQIEANYWKYVWRRLMIFAAEDVGLANPHAIAQVEALWSAYEVCKRDSSRGMPDGNLITMAVMVLARSPKSREVDDLKNALANAQRDLGYKAPYRDEMFDLHSAQGKDRWPKPQRLRQWIESASRVEPRVGPRDWHLWILRWAARKGIYSVEWVNRLAEMWHEKGLLVHGLRGEPGSWFDWENVNPEFPDVAPAEPSLNDELWPVEGPWVFTCPACKTPLNVCLQEYGGDCCSDCGHRPDEERARTR